MDDWPVTAFKNKKRTTTRTAWTKRQTTGTIPGYVVQAWPPQACRSTTCCAMSLTNGIRWCNKCTTVEHLVLRGRCKACTKSCASSKTQPVPTASNPTRVLPTRTLHRRSFKGSMIRPSCWTTCWICHTPEGNGTTVAERLVPLPLPPPPPPLPPLPPPPHVAHHRPGETTACIEQVLDPPPPPRRCAPRCLRFLSIGSTPLVGIGKPTTTGAALWCTTRSII